MLMYGKMEEQWNTGVSLMVVCSIAIVISCFCYFSPLIGEVAFIISLILALPGFVYGFFLRLSVYSKITKINKQLDLLEEEGSADDIINFGWFKHGINLANPESILSLGCDPKKLGRFILSYLHIHYEEMKAYCVGLADDPRFTGDRIKEVYLLWIRTIAYAVFQQDRWDGSFSIEFFEGCGMSRHSNSCYSNIIRNEFTHYRMGHDFPSDYLLPRWVNRRKEIHQQTELHKKLGISV